jgi:hypothetical protein
MVSGVKAFSWALLCVALVKANPAQENIPSSTIVMNKLSFMLEPPLLIIERRDHVLSRGAFQ